MNGDDRGWRWFAGATMLLFFFGLLIVAAVFDAFLSRFLPLFLGLLSVALIGYLALVSLLRTAARRWRSTPPDERKRPR